MKQHRITRKKSAAAPQIIDNRQPKATPQLALDPAIANQPIRTVIYLEVKDMTPEQVQYLIQQTNKTWDGAKGGIHYVLPIRHGKIGTDMVFEEEWERIVQEAFEIRDGQIKLKDGATDCHIIRTHLDL